MGTARKGFLDTRAFLGQSLAMSFMCWYLMQEDVATIKRLIKEAAMASDSGASLEGDKRQASYVRAGGC
jgi:hypothetical protein